MFIYDPYTELVNADAERVRSVSALHSGKIRTKRGLHLAEGPQAVTEVLIHHPTAVRDLYVTESAASRHSELINTFAASGGRIWPTAKNVLTAMSPDAQGILAVIENAQVTTLIRKPALADLLAAIQGPLVVCLMEVQDPGNMGTIIRIADAAGASAVIATRGSVEVTNPKVVRSTVGSLYHLPVITGVEQSLVAEYAQESGLQILAADGAGSTLLGQGDLALENPTMWLLGNEARGFTKQELQMADQVVAIPIYGQAESLNVASAATLCVYSSAMALNKGLHDH